MNVFEDFRENRFVDDGISKYVIEYIYNHFSLSQMDKENLHTKILAYMVSKGERDINKYLNYLKVKVPNYEAIVNKVKNEINEMKGAINGLRTNTV